MFFSFTVVVRARRMQPCRHVRRSTVRLGRAPHRTRRGASRGRGRPRPGGDRVQFAVRGPQLQRHRRRAGRRPVRRCGRISRRGLRAALRGRFSGRRVSVLDHGDRSASNVVSGPCLRARSRRSVIRRHCTGFTSLLVRHAHDIISYHT